MTPENVALRMARAQAWPLLLGAALCVACALGYRNLSDRRIAYVVPLFLIMSIYILAQLRPLRVDHHGWQILLAMLLMAQALRPASWQAGLLGGLFAAALLANEDAGLAEKLVAWRETQTNSVALQSRSSSRWRRGMAAQNWSKTESFATLGRVL